MYIWAIIIILVASIIALIIYYNEKNKSLQNEIVRLKKLMVASGYNFEQLEFRLEEIQNILKESKDTNDLNQIKKSLIKIDEEIRHIKKSIKSTNKN